MPRDARCGRRRWRHRRRRRPRPRRVPRSHPRSGRRTRRCHPRPRRRRRPRALRPTRRRGRCPCRRSDWRTGLTPTIDAASTSTATAPPTSRCWDRAEAALSTRRPRLATHRSRGVAVRAAGDFEQVERADATGHQRQADATQGPAGMAGAMRPGRIAARLTGWAPGRRGSSPGERPRRRARTGPDGAGAAAAVDRAPGPASTRVWRDTSRARVHATGGGRRASPARGRPVSEPACRTVSARGCRWRATVDEPHDGSNATQASVGQAAEQSDRPVLSRRTPPSASGHPRGGVGSNRRTGARQHARRRPSHNAIRSPRMRNADGPRASAARRVSGPSEGRGIELGFSSAAAARHICDGGLAGPRRPYQRPGSARQRFRQHNSAIPTAPHRTRACIVGRA